MSFGDKLKALRLQKGLSQATVAKKLGLINNSYVSDAEKNKFIPAEDKLRLWAEAVDISWDEMKSLLLEAKIEETGIEDPSFTMMFKEIPNMTYEEKESILRAFQAVLTARAEKQKK